MASLYTDLYNGIEGNYSIKYPIPSHTTRNNGLSRPCTTMNYKRLTKISNGNPMRYSVLKTNTGGDRGVMPCKGNPNIGGVDGVNRVLRRANIPYQGGLYPQTGYARHQAKGLAYLPEKRITGPLMPIASSFSASFISTLGQPKG